jgi:GntR family transcriptional regulator
MPPRERQPPSQRVEAALRARIAAGEWASGEALPSIATLAGEYGVSRATVAKALRRMADDGLVEIVPQWGTFRAGE